MSTRGENNPLKKCHAHRSSSSSFTTLTLMLAALSSHQETQVQGRIHMPGLEVWDSASAAVEYSGDTLS